MSPFELADAWADWAEREWMVVDAGDAGETNEGGYAGETDGEGPMGRWERGADGPLAGWSSGLPGPDMDDLAANDLAANDLADEALSGDELPDAWEPDREETSLQGIRVALLGRFGGMSRRSTEGLLRREGCEVVDAEQLGGDPLICDWIVLGGDEFPWADDHPLLSDAVRRAAAEARVEILSETQLWERLGALDDQQVARRLYTPAMLAELLGVSIAVVRRWHRRGLIVPAREVHRLPYFDFQEVVTARKLAQLLAAGASPGAIERRLAELARLVPDVERPLSQLSVIVEGKQLLLRQGEGLIDSGGQLRIDFEALDEARGTPEGPARILTLPPSRSEPSASPEQLWLEATELEELGELELAAHRVRAALAAGGPNPDLCFQLAELLYRLGDVAGARERYFMAIELDEDFVEARANLGCVLAEQREYALAIAAFEGALSCYPDYPDVHYHMARTLDESGDGDQAAGHWREFLRLAPDSPWADEAHARLTE